MLLLVVVVGVVDVVLRFLLFLLLIILLLAAVATSAAEVVVFVGGYVGLGRVVDDGSAAILGVVSVVGSRGWQGMVVRPPVELNYTCFLQAGLLQVQGTRRSRAGAEGWGAFEIAST